MACNYEDPKSHCLPLIGCHGFGKKEEREPNFSVRGIRNKGEKSKILLLENHWKDFF